MRRANQCSINTKCVADSARYADLSRACCPQLQSRRAIREVARTCLNSRACCPPTAALSRIQHAMRAVVTHALAGAQAPSSWSSPIPLCRGFKAGAFPSRMSDRPLRMTVLWRRPPQDQTSTIIGRGAHLPPPMQIEVAVTAESC